MGPIDLGTEQRVPGDRLSSASDAAGSRPQPVPRNVHSNTSVNPELESMRRIAAGDKLAFEQLFHAYHKRLFGYLFRLVGSKDAAEELTNDVLVGVWKGASGFKGESKVSTWIFGIAHFRAISWLRRTTPEVVDIENIGPLKDPRELQEEILMRESTGEEVRQAIAKLSRQHREVIELTFYQEFSYAEIAAILNCPLNTVKTRMFYARTELGQLLAKEGKAL